MAYTVKLYESTDASQWNDLVERSKNGTFLFHRNFMEYHSDRFKDFSLLVFDGNRLIALLPANRAGDEVYSHQGLTYGGMVYDSKVKLPAVIEAFMAALRFLSDSGISRLHIKLIPSIYHTYPSGELEYALFLTNAKLVRRDALAVIKGGNAVALSGIRKRGIKRGENSGLVIVEEAAFTSFWDEVLIPNLMEKHGTHPVHNAAEMTMLQQRFPENIRQFNVYHNERIVAGTTIFETAQVAHCQYISAIADQNETGCLDFLYHHLITNVFADKSYFDFGISNEQQGRKLNGGLSYWKESFGARTIVQDFYEVETGNYKLADGFLI